MILRTKESFESRLIDSCLACFVAFDAKLETSNGCSIDVSVYIVIFKDLFCVELTLFILTFTLLYLFKKSDVNNLCTHLSHFGLLGKKCKLLHCHWAG